VFCVEIFGAGSIVVPTQVTMFQTIFKTRFMYINSFLVELVLKISEPPTLAPSGKLHLILNVQTTDSTCWQSPAV
jgi:hypothetical protein